MTRWPFAFAILFAALIAAPPTAAQQPPSAAEIEAATERTAEGADRGSAEPEVEEPSPSPLPARSGDVEQIVITGEQSDSLHDQPTSSSRFSAADLKALRIENIADLADYTPNLEINTAFAASNPTIFIRGIGLKDYNSNAAGAVAVYQDGVNINAPALQLGQLFDIESIEVLRGPQGSVNGRNATGGAILIHSALPQDDFSVSSDLTYGNYDAKQVEAAINLPLVRDMLSMRVAGTANWRDGYTKNHCSGWDPTRFGFPLVDEQTIRANYDSLDASPGQWDPIAGAYRAVIINRPISGPTAGYVYLDLGAVNQLKAAGSAQITTGTPANPVLLGEDLIQPDGSPVLLPDGSPALAGTPVALQGTRFTRTEVDQVCMFEPEGNVITYAGEAAPQIQGMQGDFERSRVQPSIAQFADLKRTTNNIDNWAARTVLLFEPIENMDWTLNAHGGQNRGDSAHHQMLGASGRFRGGFDEAFQSGFNEQNAAWASGLRLGEGYSDVDGITPDDTLPGEGGGNPYAGFYSSDGLEILDSWGVRGRGYWDVGPVTLTLLADYEWYDRVVEDEGDANPLRIFQVFYSDSAWQTNEELRAEGEGDRYQWIAGLFFLYEDLTARNFFPNTRQFTIDQTYAQTLMNWAPYLHVGFDLVDEGAISGLHALNLSAGVRYNEERKEFTLASSAFATVSDLTSQLLAEETSKETWREWTGDVALSYTPFDNAYGDLISYLKYSHGFKGGHFNAGLTIKGGDVDQTIDPVEPEYIDAVEFGIRSRWFDERLTLSAAIFRYWYQDLQVFDVANDPGALPLKKLLNGDADVRGAEVELRARPIPPLLIQGNFGWLDSKFKHFLVAKTIRGGSVSRLFDYGGNPLVSAPTFSWAGIFEYEIPLLGWGALIPHWDFNYRSKVYLDPQKLDPISQDGYWLHNARLSYRTPDERIELSFWISNLFDEEYKVDVFDLSRTASTILEVWGVPRTYGVTLSLEW